MKEFEPSAKLKKKVSLKHVFEDPVRARSYRTILACLLGMYQAKLESTIAKVRDGKIDDTQILASLTKFKRLLLKDCAALIDDIWDNFRFYARQQAAQPVDQEEPRAVNETGDRQAPSLDTPELIVPHFQVNRKSE